MWLPPPATSPWWLSGLPSRSLSEVTERSDFLCTPSLAQLSHTSQTECVCWQVVVFPEGKRLMQGVTSAFLSVLKYN